MTGPGFEAVTLTDLDASGGSTRVVYTRLKALTWRMGRGVFPSVCSPFAGAYLARIVAEYHSSIPLVVNCQGVREIQDHSLDGVAAALSSTGRQVTFVNFNGEELSRHLPLASIPAPVVSDQGVLCSSVGVTGLDFDGALALGTKLEESWLRSRIARSFIQPPGFPSRLASTPLWANGVFDAREITSDPRGFIWTSLLLADKLASVLDGWSPATLDGLRNSTGEFTVRQRPVRVLAVSLRGSPLAAAASLLCDVEGSLEVVDHFGPLSRVIEEHSLTRDPFRGDFILVGDFVVGGTEVKIAESYARYRGGGLTHALVIGCFLDPSEYGGAVRILQLADLRECTALPQFTFPGGDVA